MSNLETQTNKIPTAPRLQKIIRGAGALIYSANTKRYLFLMRNTQKHSGTWGLVGGKLNPAEIPVTGLFREIQEELSVNLSSQKVMPLETFTSDNGSFVYHTFMIVVSDEFFPVLNEEHRGYCWAKLEDHPRPLHPGVWRSFNFKSILSKIKTIEKLQVDLNDKVTEVNLT